MPAPRTLFEKIWQQHVVENPDGVATAFPIDSFSRSCLLDGLDEIGLTLRRAGAIAAFEQRHRDSPAHARRLSTSM